MDIEDFFNDTFNPVDKGIQKVWPEARLVRTTNQMDGLHTEEDIAEKDNSYAQCNHCFEWVYGKTDDRPACACGSKSFDPQSTISKRTFNPETAKRRRPRGIKKR